MEKFIYQTKGVCSREMHFEVEGDIVKSLEVIGGCDGNLNGISRIIQNKSIDEVVDAFKGVRCGTKDTSCPDQIAKALLQYKNR